MKMKPPSGPKKQTQNKPNLRKAKMNLKSLAGKSGHTPLNWDCREIVAISMRF